MQRFSPLAASLLWIVLFGFSLVAFRHALTGRDNGLGLSSFLIGFGCFGGAVGSWFKQPVLGLLIGVAMGIIVLSIVQFVSD